MCPVIVQWLRSRPGAMRWPCRRNQEGLPNFLVCMQDMLLKCQLPGAPDDCLDILDDTDVNLILEEASQGSLQEAPMERDHGLLLMLTEGRAMHLPPA